MSRWFQKKNETKRNLKTTISLFLLTHHYHHHDAEKPAIIQSLTKGGFKESLDEISSEKQALFLPVVVSILLATSVVLLPFWSGGQSLLDGGKQESLSFLASLQNVATTFLPKISQAWNFALLTLFTRSELGRLGNEINLFSIVQNEKDSDTDYGSISIEAMEWIVAVGIVSLAFFFQQWPAQNFVNMALATLVARAIQLDTFSTVVAALGLLTLYDAATVFLVPAANAADVPLATVSASGSAMGSVAIQKLTSNTFQPGLLTTKIGNSLGGSLGLGDAVFPSLLATFCRRFDLQQEKEDTKINRPSLFAVSMGGYFLGCLTCEFAPMISSSGIPALVFIIPMMLASIIISATLSDDLENLIRFDPNASREIAIDETGERGG